MKKLNSRGIVHHLLLVGFVVIFAIIGAYLLVRSKASTNYGPRYVSHLDYRSVVASSDIETVTDDNPIMGINKVTEVSKGGKLKYNDKVGGNPKGIKNCYILKSMEEKSVVLLRGGNNKMKKVTLSQGLADNLWQEVCVGEGDKATWPDYVLKVESGKVRVHHMKYHYYLLPEVTTQTSTATNSSTPCVKQTLKQGSTGNCVKYIQTLANHKLPYLQPQVPVLKINGEFDAQTVQAIKAIEQNWSFDVNGIVEQRSWQALCDMGTSSVNKGGPFDAEEESAYNNAGCAQLAPFDLQ